MSEINDYQWVIEQSDHTEWRSSREQSIINFLDTQKNLPPDRFTKLVAEGVKIAKNHDIQEQKIQEECQKALKKLEWEGTMLDYITSRTFNIITDTKAHIERLTATEDKIQKFNNGIGNENIWVKDFEKELSTREIVDINSVGFGNYLIYLHENKRLSTSMLWAAFGGYPQGKEKLLNLAILWGLDNIDHSTANTNTQKQLEWENPEVLSIMKSLLSKEIQDFLQSPKCENIKKALHRKLGNTFNENEFDVITWWEIPDLKKLAEYLKKIHINNQKDLENILSEYSKDIHHEYQRLNIETKQNTFKNKSLKIEDIVNRENEIARRRTELHKLELESTAIKDPETQKWILNYLNGKIEKKEFEKLLDDQVKREEEKIHNEKNTKTLLKKNTETSEKVIHKKHTTFSEKINSIQDGESRIISFGRDTMGSKKLTIKREGDICIICPINKPDDFITLPKNYVETYAKSLRFMEKMGLGYFVQNLSQENLWKILLASSTNTTKVNTKDGKFEKDEQVQILRTFGKLFSIEKAENIQNPHDGKQLFHTFFTTNGKNIESILISQKLMHNGVLSIDTFISKIQWKPIS